MSEAQFWRATLRKLHSLHAFHVSAQMPRSREQQSALGALLD